MVRLEREQNEEQGKGGGGGMKSLSLYSHGVQYGGTCDQLLLMLAFEPSGLWWLFKD